MACWFEARYAFHDDNEQHYINASNTAAQQVALRCAGLVKRYPDVTAVDGIDLEVRTGECFGLLGPNGAGKTTTVEIFEGLDDA